MARKAKKGLTYFPLDVDFFQDIKIRKLIKYQSGKAISVYAYLLCSIYKDGYYMQWDNELPFIVSEVTGYDEAYIHEVIKSCMNIGLFSKDLFEKHKILTSKGIQERFVLVMKNLNRVSEIDEFNLVSSEEIPISSQEITVSYEETPISSEFGTQRKEKERKENKKEKEIEGDEPPITPPLIVRIDFKKIIDEYHLKCPKMPAIQVLHENRKSVIRARHKEVGEVGILNMLTKASESDFLNGENDRGWIANLDWLMKPVNFTKVLEGNFKNIIRNGTKNESNSKRNFGEGGYQIPM
ncbi:MAG: DUF4373 domain-containing protein [Bacteroidales bacterium]|nr:DUF4373 domain-containing protein [Bacteroidales bacterium]